MSQACHDIANTFALSGNTLQTCFVPSSGGSGLLPESSALEVLNWLDWEETVLRPQVHAQDSAGIKQAAQHLQSALGSRSHLVGTAPTLADIIIYVALYPVQVSILCHSRAQPGWRAEDVSAPLHACLILSHLTRMFTVDKMRMRQNQQTDHKG